jgi:hypothetical protein
MKRKTTKCRKLRHGEVITSINRWGWNNNFLGLVRKIGRTIQTTTSEPTPYPSLPLKVTKDISITRNAQNTESSSNEFAVLPLFNNRNHNNKIDLLLG